MSEFKVGDKVRIIKCTRPYIDDKYKGDIVTIKDDKDSFGRYFVMENDRPWTEEELELVEETPKKVTTEVNINANGIRIDYKSMDAVDAMRYAVNDVANTKAYDMYVKGIWKNEEEKDMNKVLELYAKRKREKIDEKYEEMVKKDYNGLQLVSEYNRIVAEFEEEMENLYKNELNFGESTIRECYSTSDYKYQLNQNKIMDNIRSAYNDSKSKEIIELGNLFEEVEAQLSLSDDLDYQREILIKYDIIDKKTGKIK